MRVTIIVTIDLFSLNKEGETWSMDTLSFSVPPAGSKLILADAQVETATVAMTGTIAKQGEAMTMAGPMSLSGGGAGATAGWT